MIANDTGSPTLSQLDADAIKTRRRQAEMPIGSQ